MQIYANKGLRSKNDLQRKLYNLKLWEDEDLQVYINKIVDLVQ